MLDFSNASEPRDFDLIPEGTLASCIISIRPYNSHANLIEKPSKNNPSVRYLDLELTIESGLYRGRKLWDVIITEHPESRAKDAGDAAIKAILEANGASPQNPNGYRIASYAELHGKRCVVRIGVEKGNTNKQTGVTYAPRNRVKTWVSPVAKTTARLWAEFQAQMSGQSASAVVAAPVANVAPAAPVAPIPAAQPQAAPVQHTSPLPWAAPAAQPGLPQGPAAWPQPGQPATAPTWPNVPGSNNGQPPF